MFSIRLRACMSFSEASIQHEMDLHDQRHHVLWCFIASDTVMSHPTTHLTLNPGSVSDLCFILILDLVLSS